MTTQSYSREHKLKLIEEINRNLEEEDGSLKPAVHKAVRLADLCGDVEYRLLFELHLDGADLNGNSGTRVEKWHDQGIHPKWDITEAFYGDRAVPGGATASSLTTLEHILQEVRDQKRTMRLAGQPVGEQLITTEAEVSEILGRIRTRIGRFVRKVETALLQETPATPANESVTKETSLSDHKVKIAVALISLAGILVVGYWQFVYKSKQTPPDTAVQYTGRVTDGAAQKAVRGAKVSIETQGPPQIQYTDSEGIFYVKLNGSAESVRIRVEATGYEGFDRAISLSRTGIEEIRLTPTNSQRRTR
jgi:hypothetical protein